MGGQGITLESEDDLGHSTGFRSQPRYKTLDDLWVKKKKKWLEAVINNG